MRICPVNVESVKVLDATMTNITRAARVAEGVVKSKAPDAAVKFLENSSQDAKSKGRILLDFLRKPFNKDGKLNIAGREYWREILLPRLGLDETATLKDFKDALINFTLLRKTRIVDANKVQFVQTYTNAFATAKEKYPDLVKKTFAQLRDRAISDVKSDNMFNQAGKLKTASKEEIVASFNETGLDANSTMADFRAFLVEQIEKSKPVQMTKNNTIQAENEISVLKKMA